VVPIARPPFEHGEVVVEHGVIQAIRPAGHRSGADVHDYGDAVLMPGLVDAHTHLEYTALRGYIEDLPFFPWIRSLTAAKSLLSDDDWLASTRLGAAECIASGITAIGDNTDAGFTAQVAAEYGMRAAVYQEVFCVHQDDPVDQILRTLLGKVAVLRRWQSERVKVGVSPHAPYTVRPELFRELSALVQRGNLPGVSIHVAESAAETRFIQHGDGPFRDMYDRRGITWDTPFLSPTEYIVRTGILNNASLAVHCVHVNDVDLARLLQTGAAIVYCPKSNAKLGAGVAKLATWLATSGARVAIGTDSAVSNNTHDLFEEMRFGLMLQRASLEAVDVVTAPQMLDIATRGGADALGYGALAGTLSVGKQADIIAVDLSGSHTWPFTDPVSALVYSARCDDVRMTMVAGEILYEDGAFLTLDWPSVRKGSLAARSKTTMDKEDS
jgi:5-methylthioadenosine/S-adenosylhomocysteine deaminase